MICRKLKCEGELKMVKNKIEGEYEMREEKSGKHVGFQHSMVFLTGLLIVLVGIVIVGMADISQAADTYVDDNAASGWYGQFHVHTIQEGINNASAGDTVHIWIGNYTENVVVNKSVTIIGNSSAWCHIQAADNSTHVFYISVDNVNISGVNISGTTGIYKAGIYTSGDDTYVYNCTLYGNSCGIYLQDSDRSKIISNTISRNSGSGVYLWGSSNNNMTNNTVNDNGNYGFRLYQGSNANFIGQNTVTSHGYGIDILTNSHNNICENNTVTSNNYGIQLHINAYENIVCNNTITSGSGPYNYGIVLSDSTHNNTVRNNSISDNQRDGIRLTFSSDNNTITNNSIQDNSNIGLYISASNNNTIYNNCLKDNRNGNAWDNGSNQWNTSKTAGLNFIGGPFLGGNYWGSYSGTDTDGDGLGNTNYSIGGGSNVDQYPLIYNLIVDDNFTSSTPGWNTTHFDTIQKGVGNATSLRNTVYVWDGTYTENVTVNKAVSIIGNGSAWCHVQTNDNTSNVFYVTSDYVNISGLNITGANATSAAGVLLSNVQHCNISNNIICGNYQGIYVFSSSNSTLFNNTQINNIWYGIYLRVSSYNNVSSNTVNYTQYYGIYLSLNSYNNTICSNELYNYSYGCYLADSYNNTILGNNIREGTIGIRLSNSYNNIIDNCSVYNNSDCGISLNPSSNTTIDNCSVYNNSGDNIYLRNSNNCTINGNDLFDSDAHGINLYSSSNCNITSNNITGNEGEGIYMYLNSNNCSVISNDITYNNGSGVYLYEPSYCNITNNNISNNTENGIKFYLSHNCSINGNYVINNSCGINLLGTENNSFYNNYLNNTNNINDTDGDNIWNLTKTLGPNIVSGSYLGGNYWSNYSGFDSDHDGLGDTNYTISSDNNDTHPLVVSPTVVSTSPSNGSTGVSRSANIEITFSKSMNQPTVKSNLTFSPSSVYSWPNDKTLIINPSSSLNYGTWYTVTIGWNATDENGNVMLENYSFTFKTVTSSGGNPPSPPPTNNPPVANAGDSHNGNVGEAITFDGTGSSDPDGDTLIYTWDFGDGTSGNGSQPTHVYTTAGTYTATLTVSDGSLTDTDTSTVTIESLPPEAPVADANGPYVAIVNQEITLDGSGSSDSDGTIANYTWLCGDGSTVNGVSPTHSYTGSGTYDIKLTVTDNDGLTDNATSTATIYDGESVDIPDGYVIDTDGDGTYDSYLNESSGVVTTMETGDDGKYNIDTNGDGEWDHTYNPENGATTPHEPKEPDEGFPWIPVIAIIILVIVVIILVLFKLGYLFIEGKNKK